MPAHTRHRRRAALTVRSAAATRLHALPLSRAVALALVLVVTGGGAIVVAQDEPALALAEATELARGNALDITSASSDLLAAERDLERALRDPLATDLERLQAQHARAAAAEALAAAERSLHVTTLQHITTVLESEATLRDAHAQADVAQRQLEADRVRAEAGTMTELDLARSATDAGRAQRAALEAESEHAIRWSELALHLGEDVADLRARGLAPIDASPPSLPQREALLERAGLHDEAGSAAHAGVAAASRALAVARVQLAGSDHEAAAPNVVANARDAVANSERRLADAIAQAELQVRAQHQAYGAALGRLADAAASDANAATTLEAQRVRADAGELAPLALRQAELERERSADTWRAARHAAWLAWWRLEQAVAGQ